ncbi:MAG: hypothetical protein ABSG37_03895 [Candidatus Limnocylindrales bacterium]|jgi:hypothetical protein
MIRKIAALVGGGALALSLIGAGVGATFTATSSTVDNINVGTMTIRAWASNTYEASPASAVGNGSCTFAVTASSGTQNCYVLVTKTGTIIPNSLAIAAAASGTIHESGSWTVSDGTTSGPLSGVLLWTYANPTFTYYVTFTVTWTNLGTQSMGDVFTITFTATASA